LVGWGLDDDNGRAEVEGGAVRKETRKSLEWIVKFVIVYIIGVFIVIFGIMFLDSINFCMK
jgi:hypothetical protein